jgi:outer membrane protein TolC
MSMPAIAAFAAALQLSTAIAQPASEPSPLSLAEAVLIAGQTEDPAIGSLRSRAVALERAGEAAMALPDPTLRVGLANLPLSNLDPNSEAMTQMQVGVRQVIPSNASRHLQRERQRAQAQGVLALGGLEQRLITRSVRLAWLEAYYWEQAGELTRARREEIRQLSEVATALFASGRGNSHDVIRVDLETALLDARQIEIDRQIGTARAQLARYVGAAAAGRDMLPRLPVLPALPGGDEALDALARHPSVMSRNARIEASEREIDLALEAYNPVWSVDAGYGVRGSRSDVASIGVSVQMPIFSQRRQDESVAGARQMRSAEELDRRALLLDLRRQLDEDWIRFQRLNETAMIYETGVLERARETTAAVLVAYENEQADFAELVRSELALLDIELTLIRTRVDALQAQSRILFLTGDVQ